MQKQKFFFLFFVLIILQNLTFISATEIQLNKETYNAGETIFATIKIDFLDEITTDDISFYRGHVLVPVIYDVTKAEDTVYIYAIAPEPETEKNYTITIKNLLVRENNTVKEMEISKNFTILPEKAEFSVNPGFVVTSKDLKIRAENKQNTEINVTAIFQNAKQQIS